MYWITGILFAVVSLEANAQQHRTFPNEYVNFSAYEGLKLDIRYATENNFMHKAVYGDWAQCYLHEQAATKFKLAVEQLKLAKPTWKFLVFDCLRPRSIQKILWDFVKDGPLKKYVANPASGSVHNFGFAMDLSLIDADGKEIDMGTPYDSFEPKAEPRLEAKMKEKGLLKEEQIANRLVLRSAMTKAGFQSLNIEWWHFDAIPGKQVRKDFAIVE